MSITENGPINVSAETTAHLVGICPGTGEECTESGDVDPALQQSFAACRYVIQRRSGDIPCDPDRTCAIRQHARESIGRVALTR